MSGSSSLESAFDLNGAFVFLQPRPASVERTKHELLFAPCQRYEQQRENKMTHGLNRSERLQVQSLFNKNTFLDQRFDRVGSPVPILPPTGEHRR